jgi:hypothetical protein
VYYCRIVLDRLGENDREVWDFYREFEQNAVFEMNELLERILNTNILDDRERIRLAEEIRTTRQWKRFAERAAPTRSGDRMETKPVASPAAAHSDVPASAAVVPEDWVRGQRMKRRSSGKKQKRAVKGKPANKGKGKARKVRARVESVAVPLGKVVTAPDIAAVRNPTQKTLPGAREVQDFIRRVEEETGRKPSRKKIALVAGFDKRTIFNFQNGGTEPETNETIRIVLQMKSADFLKALDKKGSSR